MSWLADNLGTILAAALAHLTLSVPPIVLGLVIALPIGWLANRYRLSRGAVLAICGVLYAIPSLPLFIVLPGLIGTKILDPANVVVALTIYAVALLVRSVADALASVDRETILSATAVGYSAARRFWAVELPLAGPVILAGLRVVAVSTVSLVTVGSVIGVTSLGRYFLDGYQRSFPLEIGVGIIGTLLIALLLDALLVLAGGLLMPWTRRGAGRRGILGTVARLGAA